MHKGYIELLRANVETRTTLILSKLPHVTDDTNIMDMLFIPEIWNTNNPLLENERFPDKASLIRNIENNSYQFLSAIVNIQNKYTPNHSIPPKNIKDDLEFIEQAISTYTTELVKILNNRPNNLPPLHHFFDVTHFEVYNIHRKTVIKIGEIFNKG
mgnify:CR=1 FL=1